MDTPELIRLYVEERLTLSAAAERLGCSLATAWRHLVASGVTCREAAPRYARTAFGGSPAEKAYLTGLRIGDLHVAMEGTRTIVVKCPSTRVEQVELFKAGFGDLPKMRHSLRSLAAMLTLKAIFVRTTFSEPKPQAQLEIRSYDSVLRTQLGDALNSRGIVCPPARLRVQAGYTNTYGVRSNRDLWGLGVHRRESLIKLITRIDSYIRHARRRRDMLAALEVTKSSNR